MIEVNVQKRHTKGEPYFFATHTPKNVDLLKIAVIPKYTHGEILIHFSQIVARSLVVFKKMKG